MRRRLFRCSSICLGFFGGFLFGSGCFRLVNFRLGDLRLTFQLIGALRRILNGGASDAPRAYSERRCVRRASRSALRRRRTSSPSLRLRPLRMQSRFSVENSHRSALAAVFLGTPPSCFFRVNLRPLQRHSLTLTFMVNLLLNQSFSPLRPACRARQTACRWTA